MANILHSDVLDGGLNFLHNTVDTIHIVSADPADYADLLVKSLGRKTFVAGSAFAAPANASPNGRIISSTQITDGVVTASGTAAGWAVCDSVAGKMLANGDLAAPQNVMSGNTFQLPPFSIRLPNQ